MYKIVLIGETCVDEYVYGVCDRVCPEAAALIFSRTDDPIISNAGMAGNVLRNIKSLNSFIEIFFWTNESSKPIKRRYVDKKYNTIVFREDINNTVTQASDVPCIESCDAIVISDYNKGFLTDDHYLSIRQKYPNTKIFADTKRKITPQIANCIDYLKINRSEFSAIEDKQGVINQCNVIVTNGEHGADLHTNLLGSNHFPTSKIEVRDVCGAGDTFLAGLVVRYLDTKDIRLSIPFANECAGKVVQKFGVTVP